MGDILEMVPDIKPGSVQGPYNSVAILVPGGNSSYDLNSIVMGPKK